MPVLPNRFLLFLVCLLLLSLARAQTFPLSAYIKTWSLDNEQQTLQAAVLYDDLTVHRDSTRYTGLIQSLEKEVTATKNTRLAIRLMMYEMLWHLELRSSALYDSLRTVALNGIRKAYPLKDRQLNAELYALYGELCLRTGDIEASLLYNLKSLDMQEAIGARYFPKIGWMYFSVARSLYNTRDYEQSVKYGLHCLQQIEQLKNVKLYDRIFLYDILGSGYNKTGNKDSAAWYYQQITTVINAQDPAKPETDSRWNSFWKGLVDGYLGRIELERKNYSRASVLLEHSVKASLAYDEWGNAAGFTCNLATIDYLHKQYPAAIAKWQTAYRWGKLANDSKACMDAAYGLGQAYRETGQADSSFFYYDQYHSLNDTLSSLINRSRLKAARARLDYENMQESLGRSEKKIVQEQRLRNGLLIGVALLTIISLLLYNRFRLRQKKKGLLNEQQRIKAEEEAAEAKEKLSQFRRDIVDKNDRIEQLLQQLGDANNKEVFDATARVILTEEDWTRFRAEFSKAYPHFFPALHKVLAGITPAQERLSALIYLRLDNNQIAGCLGISKDSVARSKRRLRTALNLSADTNLEEYIASLGE